jgi:hypothetical protein
MPDANKNFALNSIAGAAFGGAPLKTKMGQRRIKLTVANI